MQPEANRLFVAQEMHKKRIQESLARLQKQVASDISKKHWPRVSSDLRGQMSTLRCACISPLRLCSEVCGHLTPSESHSETLTLTALESSMHSWV